MSDIVISVRHLSKRFLRGPDHPLSVGQLVTKAARETYWKLRGRQVSRAISIPKQESFWGLKDVSFDVERCERVGIIGRNGAGKSTLLKILSRIVYPTEGEARIRGRVKALLEVGTGFNPNLSGRENIYLNASIHGLERGEIESCLEEIVEFAGVQDFLDTPVKHYSTGMVMRLGFSVASHLDPDILLLDEVLAVGDLSFQQKCLKRVESLTSGGRTVLFVSHSIDAIARFCTRCIWLDKGKIVMDGSTQEVSEAYIKAVEVIKSSYHSEFVDFKELSEQSQGDREKDGPTSPSIGENLQSVETSGTSNKVSGSKEVKETGTRLPDSETIAHESLVSDVVRLVAARVVIKSGEAVSAVAMDESVGIEITYDVLKSGNPLVPAIGLIAPDGTHIFWAVDTDMDPSSYIKPIGVHRSTAWLPTHFLNNGRYSVSLSIITPDPMERHVVRENALSFYSLEAHNNIEAARGPMGRNFPGVIRPLLAWETKMLIQEDERCKQSTIAKF